MKNWLKNNWFKFSIIFLLLVLGMSVFYYFVIFLPYKNGQELRIKAVELCKKELNQLIETGGPNMGRWTWYQNCISVRLKDWGIKIREK